MQSLSIYKVYCYAGKVSFDHRSASQISLYLDLHRLNRSWTPQSAQALQGNPLQWTFQYNNIIKRMSRKTYVPDHIVIFGVIWHEVSTPGLNCTFTTLRFKTLSSALIHIFTYLKQYCSKTMSTVSLLHASGSMVNFKWPLQRPVVHRYHMGLPFFPVPRYFSLTHWSVDKLVQVRGECESLWTVTLLI